MAAALVLGAVAFVSIGVLLGWGAWIGGLVLSALLGLLVRRQAELVAQLREAQAGLADRARAEERDRIGRELHGWLVDATLPLIASHGPHLEAVT